VSKYPYPFNKWDKEKIEDLIELNGFKLEYEYGGIFHFYYKENIFDNSYMLYLQRTGMYICDPNIYIKLGIKSYKRLDKELKEIYNARTK
jgi:hypothetical protein